MSEMNIYQRLNEVRKKVDYLRKDASVTGYKAITHDYVTSFIRKHLVEHGIMVEPKLVSHEVRDTGKVTKNGIPFTAYDAVYEVHFINMDDPKDRSIAIIGSIGEDTADKGPGSCLSYAVKYAYLKVLSIETGESEESRYDQKPDYITADQVIEIEDLVKETNTDLKKFCELGKVKSIDRLLSSQYENAVSWLKQKAENGNS